LLITFRDGRSGARGSADGNAGKVYLAELCGLGRHAGASTVGTLSTATPTTQTGTVDIQIPETVLGFTRRESSHPLTKALTYVGKINSVALGSGTFAIGTLLCLGIEGDTTDGGESYSVSYRFQYRPGTWVATVVYIDPETDRPHADVSISGVDGVEYVDIYNEVNFTALALPWAG